MVEPARGTADFIADPERHLPWKITLLLTETCNLRCRHCFSWTVTDRRALSTALVLDLVQELKGWVDRSKLFLAGGEPTRRPDLARIVAAAAGPGVQVSLTTNGSLLDEPYAAELVEAGLHHVDLSVESLDPAVHDRIRGRHGSHERVLAAAGHLDRHRRQRVERHGGRPMSMNFLAVIQEGNYRGLPDLARWLWQHGPAWLLLQPVHPPFWSRYDRAWLHRSELWPSDGPAVGAVLDELIALKAQGAPIDHSPEHLGEMKAYFLGGPAAMGERLRGEALAGARGDTPEDFDPLPPAFEYLDREPTPGRAVDARPWGQGYLKGPGAAPRRGVLGPKQILSVLDVSQAPAGVLPDRIDRCRVGYRNLNINHVGDVRLCHDMPPIGNVRQASLRALWASDRARQVRELIAHCHEPCYLLNCNYCD